MKKGILAAILLGILTIGLAGAVIYKPGEIPFGYDLEEPDYKVLAGIDVRAGQEATIDVNCYDPDGDPFMITVLNPPSGMTWSNGGSWKLHWRPAAGQAGVHYINVEARDIPPDPNDSLTDYGTFIFNVAPKNRPPELLPCGG